MAKNPPHCWCRRGWWQFEATIRGHRYQETLKTKNKAEAAARAKKRYEQIRWGLKDPQPVPTVKVFLERWLEEWVTTRRDGEQAMKLARQRIEKHCQPLLSMRLDEVSIGDVFRLRAKLDRKVSKQTKRPLSPRTIRHILSDLRCMMGYAVKTGELLRNPVQGDAFPRIQQKAPRRLSDIEVARIQDTAPEKYRLVVVLALETGMRWSELHRLTWDDIDIGRREIRVEKTKSGRVRFIVLTVAAEEALRGAMAQRLSGGRAADKWVLAHRGATCDPFVRILRECSGVRFTFHQFRHTWACRCLETGWNRELLRQQGGWATEGMTHVYGGASRDSVRQQVVAFPHDGALPEPKPAPERKFF